MVALPPRKRQAEDSLLPTRAPKQQRMDTDQEVGLVTSFLIWTGIMSPPTQQLPPRRASYDDTTVKRRPPRASRSQNEEPIHVKEQRRHSDTLSLPQGEIPRDFVHKTHRVQNSSTLPSPLDEAAQPPLLHPPHKALRYVPPLEDKAEGSSKTKVQEPREIIDLVSDDEEPQGEVPIRFQGKRSSSLTARKAPVTEKTTIMPPATEHRPTRGDKRVTNSRNWKDINTLQKDPQSSSSSQSSDRKPSFSSSSKTSSTDLTPASSIGSIDSSKHFQFGVSRPSHPKLQNDGTKVRAHQIPPRGGSSKPRKRPTKEREHIHNREYKATVAQKTRELWLKMKETSQKGGRRYPGSYEEFIDFGQYVADTARAIQGVPEEVDDCKIFTYHFERLHEMRNAINKKPLKKPFIPTIDQLEAKLRSKNQELEEATRPKYPTSLPQEDEAQVQQFLRSSNFVSKCAREQVASGDIRRLLPAQWLNDEVINFYGAMLNERAENPKAKVKRGQVMKAYYFSSFFWAKLTKDGYEKGRLAKWTKKVDIFSKDIILIPVNHQNQHWTAAAINFKQKRIESYDSLHMAGKSVCDILRNYVDAEHRNKKKKPFDFSGWVDLVAEDNPQQENGFDCGVFTCQTLEALSRGEESLLFTQDNMPYLRKRMIWEIGNARLRDGL